MQIVDIPLPLLKEALWNPNRMDAATLARLKTSISRFGLVENLVVRPMGDGNYEILSGNHRLRLLREMGLQSAPCLIVDLDDAKARVLALALNRLQGEDDIGLKAELLQKVLAAMSRDEVLEILPESAGSLQSLTSLSMDTMADYLHKWQESQRTRLKHIQFFITPGQYEIVEKAIGHLLPTAKSAHSDNPNTRGTALYLLCKSFLEKEAIPK